MASFIQEPDMRTLMTITNCVYAMRQSEVKSWAALRTVTVDEESDRNGAGGPLPSSSWTKHTSKSQRVHVSHTADCNVQANSENRASRRSDATASSRIKKKDDGSKYALRHWEKASVPTEHARPFSPPRVARASTAADRRRAQATGHEAEEDDLISVEEIALRYSWPREGRNQSMRRDHHHNHHHHHHQSNGNGCQVSAAAKANMFSLKEDSSSQINSDSWNNNKGPRVRQLNIAPLSLSATSQPSNSTATALSAFFDPTWHMEEDKKQAAKKPPNFPSAAVATIFTTSNFKQHKTSTANGVVESCRESIARTRSAHSSVCASINLSEVQPQSVASSARTEPRHGDPLSKENGVAFFLARASSPTPSAISSPRPVSPLEHFRREMQVDPRTLRTSCSLKTEASSVEQDLPLLSLQERKTASKDIRAKRSWRGTDAESSHDDARLGTAVTTTSVRSSSPVTVTAAAASTQGERSVTLHGAGASRVSVRSATPYSLSNRNSPEPAAAPSAVTDLPPPSHATETTRKEAAASFPTPPRAQLSNASPHDLHTRYTTTEAAGLGAQLNVNRCRQPPRLASPPQKPRRTLNITASLASREEAAEGRGREAEFTANNTAFPSPSSPTTAVLRAAVQRMRQASNAAMDASTMSTPGSSAAEDRYALLVESARLLSSSVLLFTALAPGDRHHSTSAARSASAMYTAASPSSSRSPPHSVVPASMEELPAYTSMRDCYAILDLPGVTADVGHRVSPVQAWSSPLHDTTTCAEALSSLSPPPRPVYAVPQSQCVDGRDGDGASAHFAVERQEAFLSHMVESARSREGRRAQGPTMRRAPPSAAVCTESRSTRAGSVEFIEREAPTQNRCSSNSLAREVDNDQPAPLPPPPPPSLSTTELSREEDVQKREGDGVDMHEASQTLMRQRRYSDYVSSVKSASLPQRQREQLPPLMTSDSPRTSVPTLSPLTPPPPPLLARRDYRSSFSSKAAVVGAADAAHSCRHCVAQSEGVNEGAEVNKREDHHRDGSADGEVAARLTTLNNSAHTSEEEYEAAHRLQHGRGLKRQVVPLNANNNNSNNMNVTPTTSTSFSHVLFDRRQSVDSTDSAFEWMADDYAAAHQRYRDLSRPRAQDGSSPRSSRSLLSASENRTSARPLGGGSPVQRRSPNSSFSSLERLSHDDFSNPAPPRMRPSTGNMSTNDDDNNGNSGDPNRLLSPPSHPSPQLSSSVLTRVLFEDLPHPQASSEQPTLAFQAAPSLSFTGSVASAGVQSAVSMERTPTAPSMLPVAVLEMSTSEAQIPHAAALFADEPAACVTSVAVQGPLALAEDNTDDHKKVHEDELRKDVCGGSVGSARDGKAKETLAGPRVLWVDEAGHFVTQPDLIEEGDGTLLSRSPPYRHPNAEGYNDRGPKSVAPQPKSLANHFFSSSSRSRGGDLGEEEDDDDVADLAAPLLRGRYAASPAPVVTTTHVSSRLSKYCYDRDHNHQCTSSGSHSSREESSSMSSASTSPEHSQHGSVQSAQSEESTSRAAARRGLAEGNDAEAQTSAEDTQETLRRQRGPHVSSNPASFSVTDAMALQTDSKEQSYTHYVEDVAAPAHLPASVPLAQRSLSRSRSLSTSSRHLPPPFPTAKAAAPRTRLSVPAAASKPPMVPTSSRPRLAEPEYHRSLLSPALTPPTTTVSATNTDTHAGLEGRDDQRDGQIGSCGGDRGHVSTIDANFFDEEDDNDYCGYGYGEGEYMDV